MNLAETAINAFLDRKLARPAKSSELQLQRDRSLAKGLVAGIVAGLAATAAKAAVEKLYPPRPHSESGRELALVPKDVATDSSQWAFGATVGAAYGALAEYYPAASSHDGVSFGVSLMALTHEAALPSIGFAAAPADQTRREKTSEMASYIIFGLVAESTRRLVRKML